MTDEKTPEKIVLPRSGLVLTFGVPWSDIQDEVARSVEPTWSVEIVPGVRVMLVQYEDGSAWDAMFGESWEKFSVREQAIGWLDARVLSLRSALLAGAEDRIARTCFEWDRGATWEERTNSDVENYMDQARAVLAALCGEASK